MRPDTAGGNAQLVRASVPPPAQPESFPPVSVLFHPGVLFAAVWVPALVAWALLSPEWLLRVAGAVKNSSLHSTTYVLLAGLLFVIGTVLGPMLLRIERRPAVVRAWDSSPTERHRIVRGVTVIAAIGALCGCYLLLAGTIRFGGFGALFSYVTAGGSWEYLEENAFRPVRIAGITVWLHLLVAVGPLATVIILTSRERTELRRVRLIFAASFVLIVVLSFAYAERLIAFSFIVGSAVAWVGLRARAARKSSTGRTAMRVAGLMVVVVLLWGVGEFSRTYLSTRSSSAPVTSADIGSSQGFVSDRFLAYVIGSVNNGMYSIDHQESVGYAFYLASAAVTAANLDNGRSSPISKAAEEQERQLYDIYPYGNPLTTFGLPASLFADVRWAGLLVMLWFGVLSGCVFVRFRERELWALLVYPGVVVGILDSYRLLYWTRTEMVVPLVAFLVICLPLYRARADIRQGVQSRLQATPRLVR